MKKTFGSLLACLLAATGVSAAPLTVCDFENYAIGTSVPMWHVYGGTMTSTATVVADPTNPANKVLHVVLEDWCAHPEFVLPTTLRGSELTKRYGKVRYRLYRSAGDEAEWKQFAAFVGSQEVYRDEGYPSQGAKETWQTKEYVMSPVEDSNTSDRLRLGMNAKLNIILRETADVLTVPYDAVQQDENGNDVEFLLLDVVEYNNDDYMVMIPLDDEEIEDDDEQDEVVILKVIREGDEETYSGVEDEDVLNAVFEIFQEQNADEDED